MLDQLVLAIVLYPAIIALVRLVVGVSSDVIVSVPDGCETLVAVTAWVGFFTRVHPHMNYEVTTLIKSLITKRADVSLSLAPKRLCFPGNYLAWFSITFHLKSLRLVRQKHMFFEVIREVSCRYHVFTLRTLKIVHILTSFGQFNLDLFELGWR